MEKISKTKNRQRNFHKRGLVSNHHAMEAIDDEKKKNGVFSTAGCVLLLSDQQLNRFS
jgi:hypothetical protein